MRPYVINDLTAISADLGAIRYLIEFQDLLESEYYFGKIFSTPDIRYKNNNIHEVSFDKSFNDAPSSESFDISSALKSKYDEVMEELEVLKDTDPNAEQAYLVMKDFETRWLDADNITLVEGGYILNQWGIKTSKLPELPEGQRPNINGEMKEDSEDHEDLGELGKIETKSHRSGLYGGLFFLVLLFIWKTFFLSGNSKSDSDSLLNTKTNKGRIMAQILVFDEKSKRRLSKDLEFTFTDRKTNQIRSISGTDANQPIYMGEGAYSLKIEKDSYYPKTVQLKLDESSRTGPKEYKLRKKGIIKRIFDKLKI